MNEAAKEIEPPQKLSAGHDLSGFDSGDPALDEWLRRPAFRNEASGASRTYVLCAGRTVIGYYTLAVGAVTHTAASGRIKRNMPDPIPVMVLGRMAVTKTYQGRGLGTGLLRDAVIRTAQAAEIAGIRAILVHVIAEQARRFSEKYGFRISPVEPMTVMISLAEAIGIITGRGI
jgi:GNAT superfamily N-acetyltransferase